MSDNDVIGAVLDQFRRALRMFRETIIAFPPDEWHRGDIDYLRPAGVAYHVIESIDFYTGNQPPDKFSWGARFGVDWENKHSDRLPSQGQLTTYLDEVEDKLQEWFEKTDLLAAETTYPWTGSLVLARAIYILRNIQHHLSEMSLELTRRGYQSPEWL